MRNFREFQPYHDSAALWALKSDMKTDGAGHRKVTRVEPAINGVESKEINKSAEKIEESKDENNPE